MTKHFAETTSEKKDSSWFTAAEGLQCSAGREVEEEGPPSPVLGAQPVSWLDFVVNLAQPRVTWEALQQRDCPDQIGLLCPR